MELELHVSTELLEFTDKGASRHEHLHYHQLVAAEISLAVDVTHPLMVALPAHEQLVEAATALETFATGEACELARLDGNPEAAVGAQIHVQLGDNDALDDYRFRIDSLDGRCHPFCWVGKWCEISERARSRSGQFQATRR